jgi:hypothetical protein
VLHPAQLLQLNCDALQAAQVAYVGVPVQVGPALNVCGAGGAEATVVEQQSRADGEEQSLLLVHDLGQVFWQMPLQQSSPVAVQSLDCAHVLGHGSNAGLRHSPVAVTLGSTLWTDWQQTSPMLV